MTVAEQLTKLQTRVRAAEERLQGLDVERRHSARAIDRAKGPLLDYYRELGAGEVEPDPETERELLAGVRAAAEVTSTRPSVDRTGNFIGLEQVDDRVEQQIIGARQALERRQEELRRFAVDRFDDLAAELAAEAPGVRDAQLAAIDQWSAADGTRAHLHRKWVTLGQLTGRFSPEDLPPGVLGYVEGLGQALAELDMTRRRDPDRLLVVPRSLQG